VRKPGTAKKWKAEILCEGKVCDLAILTVKDALFWSEDLKGLIFVPEPELQASISVAGYPVGGDSLSITKGIVSRLAIVRYSAVGRLLGVQIDAAINPGNSGGPAFADLENGQVAGVAFSKNVQTSTDNIGYIIPMTVVRHFLDEFDAHASYRGVPAPGFNTQDMENPAQRAYLQVPEGASGVMVVSVDPLSPASGLVQVNDCLLEVDGQPVADDGTAVFRDDERLEYSYLVRRLHVGDNVELKLLRGGNVVHASYKLEVKDHLVPQLHGVDSTPSYFIVGGLVFTPCSAPFLDIMFARGSRTRRVDLPVPVMVALTADKEFRGQQVIVLVQVLAHEINHGYKYSVTVCESFNGVKLTNLKHLTQLVDSCPSDFLNFGLEGGRLITLSRDEAVKHGPSILAVNAVPSDRSDDLIKVPSEDDMLVDNPAAPATTEPQPQVVA